MNSIPFEDGSSMIFPDNTVLVDCSFRVISTGEIVQGKEVIQKIAFGEMFDIYGYVKLGKTAKDCKQFRPCDIEVIKE